MRLVSLTFLLLNIRHQQNLATSVSNPVVIRWGIPLLNVGFVSDTIPYANLEEEVATTIIVFVVGDIENNKEMANQQITINIRQTSATIGIATRIRQMYTVREVSFLRFSHSNPSCPPINMTKRGYTAAQTTTLSGMGHFSLHTSKF